MGIQTLSVVFHFLDVFINNNNKTPQLTGSQKSKHGSSSRRLLRNESEISHRLWCHAGQAKILK